MMQKSMSLKNEPATEPLHISDHQEAAGGHEIALEQARERQQVTGPSGGVRQPIGGGIGLVLEPLAW